MKTFEIIFTHTVEQTYKATVQALNKEEAKELLEESPFDYLKKENEAPFSEQGLKLTIDKIKEIS